MPEKSLTPILINPKNPNFDYQYNILTIQKGEYFEVGIKEYIDENKRIDQEIIANNQEIDKINNDLIIEKDILLQQANNRYKEGGKWIKEEIYNGEKVSFAQVNYNENIKVVNKNAQEKIAKLKEKNAELNKKLEELKKEYKNVSWVWELAKQKSGEPSGHNNSLTKGAENKNLTLEDHILGGGFAWIEPFFDNNKPTRNNKNGFYVHSEPKNPHIITIEWFGVDQNKELVKITRPVAMMSKVQLHIYTSDLYGQNIRIELKANGKTLKANTYGDVFIISGKRNKSETKYEIYESENLFYSEIDVVEYSSKDTNQPPAEATKGYLVDSENLVSKPSVQKAILEFYIDPSWIIGQRKINIQPTIHFFGQAKTIEIPLTVLESLPPDIKMPDTGNKPVFVDKIETNINDFHPCGYSEFIINDGKKSINLFEDKTQPPLTLFELVAGPVNNTQTITINVNSDTKQCFYDGKENDHENNVLNITEFPEKKAMENTQKEKSSVTFTTTTTAKIGNDKNYIQEKSDNIFFQQNLEVFTKTDQELKFKARYNYNDQLIRISNYNLSPLFRYIWLGKGVETNTYLVKTATCRYQQNISIVTYPDIAWSLKLTYGNIKTEKEVVSNQRYKDTRQAKFKRPPQTWTTIGDKNFGISLGAKWDKENEYNATADITEQIKGLFEKMGAIGKFIEKVFLGNENKQNPEYTEAESHNQDALNKIKEQQEEKAKLEQEEAKKDKELNELRKQLQNARNQHRDASDKRDKQATSDKISSLQRKMDKRSADLKLNLTRSVATIQIQYPQIEAEFNWSRENIDLIGPHYNQTGVVLEGVLNLSPLVGLTAALDFLALAQRSHPVALAVIAAADITMALIGDGSQITCELSASGTFGGKLQGFINTTTGENSFNKEDRNANDKQLAELNCSLEFKLKIAIKIEIKTKRFFVKVTLTGEIGAEATAKWSGKAPIDADDNGWYIAPELTFEGLEIKGEANINGKIGDDKNPLGNVNSYHGFKWQAIDAWIEPKKFDKMYFIESKN